VFSWQAYLDEKNRSPHREQLIVGGKPIGVKKLDAYTVVFELQQPYAVGERLFDGIADAAAPPAAEGAGRGKAGRRRGA
jgi:ABC-type transport system substrate-binding protein